VVVYWR